MEKINFSFYFIFLFEVFVKGYGLGIKAYLKDGYNIFDLALILISTVDTILEIIILIQNTEGGH